MADVSEGKLVSTLSESVNPRKMLWAEAALAHCALCGDLNPEDLLCHSFLSGSSKTGTYADSSAACQSLARLGLR